MIKLAPMARESVPLAALAKKRSDPSRDVGGKASRLVWLMRNGFAVPNGWVLRSSAFERALEVLPHPVDASSLVRIGSSKTGENRIAKVREQLREAPLPEGIGEDLDTIWNESEGTRPWGLAVRSSATCEDGQLLSMAGIATSVLGVTSRGALEEAVRAVWISLVSGRALAYLSAHGVREVSMAVVIQVMVEAEAAGVLFTRASDIGGPKNERVVNASFGLGAPVVDGVSNPDLLRMDQRGRIVHSIVSDKPSALVVRNGLLTTIPSTSPGKRSLSDAQLLELAEVAKRLEKLESHSWDVEFACDAKQTWIIQARPVSHSAFPTGGDENTLWSNANVGEALPGVATPLTWSVAGAFSETGFRRAFGALGCSVPKDARLVSSVYGRFYLNISSFMRIARQVPWLDPKMLLDLAGCPAPDSLSEETNDVSHKGFFLRLPFTAAKLAAEQLRLDADVAKFEAYADATIRAHRALDLGILPDAGVARRIRDAQTFLERTGTVMLTCASSALGSHLILQMLIARVTPFGAEQLAQLLTAGIRDLESARPAIAILRISELARREPEAQEVLTRDGSVDLSSIPEGPTKRALLSFLDLYGDRAVREAELSMPRWREDPTPILTMLRVGLRGQERPIEATLEKARASAEEELLRVIPKLGIVEQTLLRHIVVRAQRSARLRERMRAWVTRVLGLLREVFLDADRRLLRLDAALTPGSVFFLTVDEVVHALSQENTQLRALVETRRAEFLRNSQRPDPPPSFVGAPHGAVVPPLGTDVLRGIGASSGVVEGSVRILTARTLGEFKPGEVLVVHTTDVGWTPLFLSACAVVTELGGPLSHATIVAREFGVPTVVNVEGATRLLRTGDRVRVDGSRGTVERID